MEYELNQKDYWEDQARRSIFPDEKGYYDHPFRKRMILKYLLDYDFENKNIIEIGCGIASTAKSLKDVFPPEKFKYHGIDISDRFSSFAHYKFGLDVKQGDICNILYGDNIFDCMFLFDVLEHIPFINRAKAYLEIDRVLKHGAMIFINNPISMSHHDPKFEYGFSLSDLKELCEAIKGIIMKMDFYNNTEEYLYHFIVIERHKREVQ